MKLLFLILLNLFVGNSMAQDFNVEYKAFMLQAFFKQRGIQSLTIEEAKDSTFKQKATQYKLIFDSEGRLVKVYDYYFDRDTIPERLIKYAYSGNSPYYSAKAYYYFDESQKIVMKRAWELSFDFFNNILEEGFVTGKKQFRTNSLIFNKTMQLLSRTVEAFVVKLRTGFTYNKDGLLKQVMLIKENPTLKHMKYLELNHYLQYNKYRKVMTTEQWLGERNKQINEYFFIYKGQEITAREGWSLMNWSSSDKKRIERINFSYHQNGLIAIADAITEKEVSPDHRYTQFKYTFFTELPTVKISSHRFVSLWFTDIFAEHLTR